MRYIQEKGADGDVLFSVMDFSLSRGERVGERAPAKNYKNYSPLFRKMFCDFMQDRGKIGAITGRSTRH
jgi:hypothetical protein